MTDRAHDIILYGATGFVGVLTAAYRPTERDAICAHSDAVVVALTRHRPAQASPDP